jgi:hypothetical protein
VSKRCLVVAIVEDEHHRMLIYRYLLKRGMWPIRIEISPSGRGSAENWVRKTFVKEVSAYRRRHAQTALLVVIDADTVTVQHRQQQLDQALRDSGKDIVDPARERIARLVPKRNVETWILCLNGHEVDEERNCKNEHHAWNDLIPVAAETLFQWTRSNAESPDPSIDSLRNGVKELKRLAL